jgi:O-antigen/teichoic acid export membrane protein
LSRQERNERILNPELQGPNLSDRVVKGGLTAFAGQITRFAIQLIGTAIISRILAPEDFGIIAMAATITSFVGMVMDMGLTMATIQKKELTQEIVSALFWMNIAIGVALCLILIALSPAFSLFYKDPRLTGVLIALSLSIPITSASLQHSALLSRNLQWNRLQVILVASQVAGYAFALLYAFQVQMNYWAIVVQNLGGAVVTLLLSWFLCRWTPSLRANFRAASAEIRYGMHLSGFNFINFLHRQFDNILIGRQWGPAELGMYARAYNIFLLPTNFINGPIGSIIMPVLSRLQDNRAEWKRYYLSALMIVTILGNAIAVLLISNSHAIIVIVLGEKWAHIDLIFLYLSVSLLASSPMHTYGWLYQSIGKTREMLWWGAIATALWVLSFVIGLPWKSEGVALAYSSMTLALLVPCFHFATRGTNITLGDILRSVIPVIAMAVFAIAVSRVTLDQFPQTNIVLELLLGGSISMGIYGVCILAFATLNPGMRDFRAYALKIIARGKGD